MTKEQMVEGLRYINSLGDTIMHPTSDYVNAMITVIEGSRDVLPEGVKPYSKTSISLLTT